MNNILDSNTVMSSNSTCNSPMKSDMPLNKETKPKWVLPELKIHIFFCDTKKSFLGVKKQSKSQW